MQREIQVLDWWKKYESLLLHIAQKDFSIPEDIAKELVQEVAILVLRKLPHTVDNEKIFQKWVKTTLRNRVIDWLRKNRIPSINIEKDDWPSALPNQEEALFLKEILELIEKLLTTQRIVMLKMIEGKSVEKIAEELQIKEATARSDLRHARANLSRLLEVKERGVQS